MTPETFLAEHVARFNAAVAGGDWSAFVAQFTERAGRIARLVVTFDR